jgi:phosphate-selective porin OprO/OprP
MYRDGVDFRRARLRIDGTMYEVMEFAMEYDFVNGLRAGHPNNADFIDQNVTAITDLWLQFSHTPLGNIRIGNQKEPMGFEHIVSSRYLPFMERSYNQDTFYGGSFNGFTPGASLFGNYWEDRASYNIGIYKPTNNVFGFNNNDGDYAVTGRLTWLPIYENEGRQLLHLGVSARQATTYDDRIRYRTRDAMRAGVSTQWPVPADITVFGDTMQWLDLELAMVQGPWTLQAEWLVSNTTNAQFIGGGPEVQNLLYQGGYVQLMYFLTGESDNYVFDKMAFDRVKPFENAFWVKGADGCRYFGRGAWQVGARYNYLDLNDQGINGGILHNFTAGLNWFFNPNSKWQFNYIATYRDVSQASDPNLVDGSGWIHGFGMRFAQDF